MDSPSGLVSIFSASWRLFFCSLLALSVMERTAVATLSLLFSLGGSVIGKYAYLDGSTADRISIWGILRSPLRQIRAVGVKARDKKWVKGNQNQNWVKTSRPT